MYLIQIVHGLAIVALPLLNQPIVLDAGLLVAIEAYKIFPTQGRSHLSTISSTRTREITYLLNWHNSPHYSVALSMEILEPHVVDPCRVRPETARGTLAFSSGVALMMLQLPYEEKVCV
jgi:hypothetical protein